MALQLGRYQLIAELARGGMGIVYLAIAQGPARFSKLLVIKELKPELVEDEAFLQMFLEEARLAARLSHPNIVQTYEIDADGKRHYIVMEYLDGITLARVLRRRSPLFTRNMHLRVISEIVAGLHYAHTLKDFDGTDLGIVHRDVTPQNVFITFDGVAKIVDFGIAKAVDSTVETRAGMFKGKPAYMAPEQISGEIDSRADIYSAGVMIWEAVARRRMWAKKADMEILTSMLRGEAPSIRDHATDLPDELASIVERALARDPDERFQTASELHEALEAFLASDPTSSMREVSRVVASIFEEEREATRSRIEEHLARASSEDATGSILPTLTVAHDTRTPTGASGLSQVTHATGMHTPGGSSRSLMGERSSDSSPPGPKRKRGALLLVAGLLLATGASFAVGVRVSSKKSADEAAPVSGPIPTEGATPPPVTSSEAAHAARPSSNAAAAEVEEPTEEAGAEQAEEESPPELPRSEPTPSPAPPPARAPFPAPKRPPLPTPEVGAPEPEPPKPQPQPGYLTFDTYPWTRVTLGGKVLGDTPLVRIALPAGTHTLVLENPTENVRETTVVTIKPGETLSRRLAF